MRPAPGEQSRIVRPSVMLWVFVTLTEWNSLKHRVAAFSPEPPSFSRRRCAVGSRSNMPYFTSRHEFSDKGVIHRGYVLGEPATRMATTVAERDAPRQRRQAGLATEGTPGPSNIRQILESPLGSLTEEQIQRARDAMLALSGMERWGRGKRQRRGGARSKQSSRRRSDGAPSNAQDGARQASPRKDALLVESLLDRLVRERQNASPSDVARQIHTVRTANLAIRAWSNSGVRGSAQKAEAILDRLIRAYESSKASDPTGNKDPSLRPEVFSFAYAYSAWYRTALREDRMGNGKAASTAIKRSGIILDRMRDSLLGVDDGTGLLKDPKSIMIDCNVVLNEWVKSGKGGAGMARMAERFLTSLEALREASGGRLRPMTSAFNCVINAWARSGEKDSSNLAEAILNRMEDETSRVKPDAISYTTVIIAISNSGRADSAEKAQLVLERMQGTVEPDTIAYNAVLNAWAKSRSKQAHTRAQSLLTHMESTEPSYSDIRSYNTALGIIARQRGAQDAASFVERMEKSYSAGDIAVRPNSATYSTCIDAYANERDAAGAIRVLDGMEASYRNGNIDAMPTERCYTSVLNALSKSRASDSGVQAEQLFQRMQQNYESGNLDMKPNTRTYNTLINVFANERGKKAALKGEKLLDDMESMYREGNEAVKPDVVSYTTVINSWSRSGDKEGGQRADLILGKMQEAGVKPNSRTFNAAISAWSRSGVKGAAQKAEALLQQMTALYEQGSTSATPDVFTFTSVIDSWAKSGEPGSARRAEILLKLMEVMYKNGNKAARPNVQTFTSVIDSWSKSGEPEAGLQAEKLLERMEMLGEKDETVRPNTITYTAVIDAHARSGVRGSAERAELLLKKMEKQYEDGNRKVKPNYRTFNSVISAWARSGEMRSAQKATSILLRMEDRYNDGKGDRDAKPTVITYVGVINAWVGSLESGKAQKARDLLRKLIEQYEKKKDRLLRPNVVPFTAVINACAECCGNREEKDEAMQIAYATFKELEGSDYDQPNQVTFAMLMRACANLIPVEEEKRNQVAAAIFRKCCRLGLVNQSVLTEFKTAASDDLVNSLMGGMQKPGQDGVTLSDLPSEWTCNVKRRAPKRRG